MDEKLPVEGGTRGGKAWKWRHLLLVLAAAAAWLGLSAVAGTMGELNQDEGWYLYAAKMVREGAVPYRDFAFTQGPVAPLAYAALYNWVERNGVGGGRSATFLFGGLASLLAVWLAMRIGPRNGRRTAGAFCFVLLGVNAYQCQFATMVKTYALASLLFGLGLLLLSRTGRRGGGGFLIPGLAGFFLALAAATRVSFGAALAAGGVYLVLVHRKSAPWSWLDYGLGGVLGLVLAFAPFVALGGDGFAFGMVEYHLLREGGSGLGALALKAGCASRLVQAYFPAFAAGGILATLAWGGRRRAAGSDVGTGARVPAGFTGFLWVVLVLMAGVHLAAPFPYDDYQVPLYPLFCALVGAGLARQLEKRGLGGEAAYRWLWAALCFAGVYAFASPSLQGWFVEGRDRVWWRLRERSALAQLRAAADAVRAQFDAAGVGPGDRRVLLTQDTYLAVEAGAEVPHGLEMGPFSYYPDLDAERASSIGVVNREGLLDIIRSGEAAVAAASGYTFAVACPEVEPVSEGDAAAIASALEAGYEETGRMERFGQAATELRIFRRRAGILPMLGKNGDNLPSLGKSENGDFPSLGKNDGFLPNLGKTAGGAAE